MIKVPKWVWLKTMPSHDTGQFCNLWKRILREVSVVVDFTARGLCCCLRTMTLVKFPVLQQLCVTTLKRSIECFSQLFGGDRLMGVTSWRAASEKGRLRGWSRLGSGEQHPVEEPLADVCPSWSQVVQHFATSSRPSRDGPVFNFKKKTELHGECIRHQQRILTFH